MLQNYLKIRWLALLLVAFSITACKKCKDEPLPVDPCAGKPVEFKADMEFGYSLYLRSLRSVIIPVDTYLVYDSRDISFRAIGNYESVSWKIGSDTREFTDTSFTLSFSNQEDRIPIRMIAKRKLSEVGECKNLRLYDTVTKIFTKINYSSYSSPLPGYYLGALQDFPNDTFRLQIKETIESNGIARRYQIIGLLNQCLNTPKVDKIDIISIYRNFGFDRSGGGPCPNDRISIDYGSGYLGQHNKTLTVSFTQYDANTARTTQRKFIGVRVP